MVTQAWRHAEIHGVVAFKESSVLSEEDQIEFLFRFLKGFDGRKEEDRELLYQYAGIAVSSVVLPSQTCVKIIADVYGRNFWKLWWAIKDHQFRYNIRFRKSQLIRN